MKMQASSSAENGQTEKLRGYYRFHARIYGATRWAFLFGRREAVEQLGLVAGNRRRLLEIGCGTGHNLLLFARCFPQWNLTGVDISPEMLAVARKKLSKYLPQVRVAELPYGQKPLPIFIEKPQAILISYCLTMVNPGWEAIIRQAAEDLTAGGKIAVVDFHQSRVGWFRRWMRFNHVEMEGQLLPVLESTFSTVSLKKRSVYFGLWEYFVFVGEKKMAN